MQKRPGLPRSFWLTLIVIPIYLIVKGVHLHSPKKSQNNQSYDAQNLNEGAKPGKRPMERVGGMTKRTGKMTERNEGLTQRAEGIIKQGEGVIERTEGTTERGEGIIERTEETTKRGEGLIERVEGFPEAPQKGSVDCFV